MLSSYHEGELEVQRLAGVLDDASKKKGMYRTAVPDAAQVFLSQQFMVIVTTLNKQQVWTSVLLGDKGFITMENDHTLRIRAVLGHEAASVHLINNPSIGLIAIELETRKRMRVNGKAQVLPDTSILLQTEQVYSNCPKYIQARTMPDFNSQTHSSASDYKESHALTSEQQAWISNSDTFFIGSFHPEGGADASHRGGNRGFVDVIDESTIRFPDYKGNSMFNTLGNLLVNPHCGLLFIDFEKGNILQLTGQASIIWNEHLLIYPVAERVIEFLLDQVVQRLHIVPAHWVYVSASPFNF